MRAILSTNQPKSLKAKEKKLPRKWSNVDVQSEKQWSWNGRQHGSVRPRFTELSPLLPVKTMICPHLWKLENTKSTELHFHSAFCNTHQEEFLLYRMVMIPIEDFQVENEIGTLGLILSEYENSIQKSMEKKCRTRPKMTSSKSSIFVTRPAGLPFVVRVVGHHHASSVARTATAGYSLAIGDVFVKKRTTMPHSADPCVWVSGHRGGSGERSWKSFQACELHLWSIGPTRR